MIRTPKKGAPMTAQHCTCNPPCTTRALKRAAHGTPREFERAVFKKALALSRRIFHFWAWEWYRKP